MRPVRAPHLALICAVLAGLIAGCGETAEPEDQMAARVGSATISESAVVRFVVGENPDRAAGRGWGPPRFRACVASPPTPQRGTPEGMGVPAPPVRRRNCAADYLAEKGRAAQFLVRAAWYESERRRGKPGAESPRAIRVSRDPVKFQAFRARVEQLDEDLLAKARVSDENVADYYERHRSRFEFAPVRQVRRVITRSRQRAVQARRALEADASWQQVYKRYSDEQRAQELDGTAPYSIGHGSDTKFARIAFQSDIGKLSGPVRAYEGWYVFQVKREEPAFRRPLSEMAPLLQRVLSLRARDSQLVSRYGKETTCYGPYKRMKSLPECRGSAAYAEPDPVYPR